MLFRSGDQRGHSRGAGHDSRQAFSGGDYHDPAWTGFGALRVCNEDLLAPGAALPPQRRANMEILELVLDGSVTGSGADGAAVSLPAGTLHLLSAGHGAEHRLANASATQPARVLRLWLQPDRVNASPAASMLDGTPATDGSWTTLASPDGRDGGLALRLQGRLQRARLAPSAALALPVDPARRVWLQVLAGTVDADGRPLLAGDAVGWDGEAADVRLVAGDAPADLLLLTLPR
ncbi:pirin family protein [Luteimonas sp. BDR2-5]|uniref:pirin family protein n=1 Tax=Proluteimonas luteida TaxID=2878685 RepID=UPI001E64D349|nr:pirin family protein [Luteimonas sp. BDR2-5]MCD9030060.1 pirin family protein [Luteimonas sp. BDR2-5]